jgi:hypothetical protein
MDGAVIRNMSKCAKRLLIIVKAAIAGLVGSSAQAGTIIKSSDVLYFT